MIKESWVYACEQSRWWISTQKPTRDRWYLCRVSPGSGNINHRDTSLPAKLHREPRKCTSWGGEKPDCTGTAVRERPRSALRSPHIQTPSSEAQTASLTAGGPRTKWDTRTKCDSHLPNILPPTLPAVTRRGQKSLYHINYKRNQPLSMHTKPLHLGLNSCPSHCSCSCPYKNRV